MGNKLLSAVGIVLACGVPIMIIIGGIIDWIIGLRASIEQNKKNQEWMKEHNRTTRMSCIFCPYCRYSYHHAFYTPQFRNVLVSKVPKYCSKLKVKLNGDSMLRCVAKDASQAMWEKSPENYYIDLNKKWTAFDVILVLLMAANLIVFVWKAIPISIGLKIALMCIAGSLLLLLVVSFVSAFDVIHTQKRKQLGFIGGSIVFMLLPSTLICISIYNTNHYPIAGDTVTFWTTLLYHQSPFYGLSIVILIAECCLLIVSIIIAITGHQKEEKLREEIIKERKLQKQRELEEKLDQREKILNKIIGEGHSSFLHLPDDVFFTDDGVPIKGDTSEITPYGEFTVYTTHSGRSIHSVHGCSGATIPKHLLFVSRSYSICQKCGNYSKTQIPDWFWVYMNNKKQ